MGELGRHFAAQHLAFDWLWVVATIIFAVAVPLTGLVWGRMLRVLDRDPAGRLSAVEAIVVQCASWLLKYIPGQVGSVVNKVVWAGKKGISRSLVLITFVYENMFLQVASIVPSVVILLASLGPRRSSATTPRCCSCRCSCSSRSPRSPASRCSTRS